jgi:hypothetical protein
MCAISVAALTAEEGAGASEISMRKTHSMAALQGMQQLSRTERVVPSSISADDLRLDADCASSLNQRLRTAILGTTKVDSPPSDSSRSSSSSLDSLNGRPRFLTSVPGMPTAVIAKSKHQSSASRIEKDCTIVQLTVVATGNDDAARLEAREVPGTSKHGAEKSVCGTSASSSNALWPLEDTDELAKYKKLRVRTRDHPRRERKPGSTVMHRAGGTRSNAIRVLPPAPHVALGGRIHRALGEDSTNGRTGAAAMNASQPRLSSRVGSKVVDEVQMYKILFPSDSSKMEVVNEQLCEIWNGLEKQLKSVNGAGVDANDRVKAVEVKASLKSLSWRRCFESPPSWLGWS